MITKAILKGEKVPWNRLFKKFCFFRSFEHFIQIQILSVGLDEHDKWLGYAESKIKKVVDYVSKEAAFAINSNKNDIIELRTYPNSYSTHSVCPAKFAVISSYYIGIRVKNKIAISVDSIDFTDARKKFFDWFNSDTQIKKNPVVENLL